MGKFNKYSGSHWIFVMPFTLTTAAILSEYFLL
jgi:hypothetical protein